MDRFTLLFHDFQPLLALTTTFTGVQRLQPLWETAAVSLWVPAPIGEQIQQAKLPIPSLQVGSDLLREHLTQQWPAHRGLIFCLATGAVVRLISPLLQHKATDPAVVVVDTNGQFVISLCGGHQAGADALAQAVARQLHATPVLTGAANGLALPAIDRLGKPFGWQPGSGDWTAVSSAIARQEPVQVIQEAGSTLWQNHLPAEHSFQFGFPEVPAPAGSPPTPSPRARIWISPMQRSFSLEADFPKVQWHPRVLWVGIGCERGTSRALIETAVQSVCRAHHLAEAAIAGVATIDLKANEIGLVELCQGRQWPLRCFSAEQLRQVSVPTPSAVVEAEVGTPSVAEAAAILAASPSSDASLLRVRKQIIRQPDQPGAVTIAIAQADQEYTGRRGQLWLVGIGPGQLNQITPAAQTAITHADAVIGYRLYVDLIQALLRPGQIVEALPITQERQRAERAIELANWGLTVAVISSGDCGIYGMAGLVMEQLQHSGWDGKTPAVEVFPGITALQAAAAQVGAPLMHDFCAISLSDLLTPWTVIETRLSAAAQADFVTALYNPKSQTRTQQIETAQQIFLAHRAAQTPVAIVRSVYRPDQQVTLTTLDQMLAHPIDMLTVVLIGNQSTRTFADWMITPRGYLASLVNCETDRESNRESNS
ncbi:precorrin-3B C(17)-methyltransferase [Leptolyngbya sp. NK1-12]|uniref:Precorrin-3B C(17)-methyltransferase n=1 Tax=Leptolyngbya sp. NK1-12 TaxID=2547451 RepID=A0AA96WED7_9CYAN|nr:precorrin-3B C(17)-methyltransferase [Leptolyngbya sp. NK1-12]WNZ24667.1 precorrin-3B C(17)-methyltransferase [Leptolyngbya sp. NK1-12]